MTILGRVATPSMGRPAPTFVIPMAALAVRKLPEGGDWLYEPKLDGYRALLLKDGKRVQILSRNEKDLTQMYPTVTAAALRLRAEQAVVDGEIVALSEDGRPSFQALQHRGPHQKHLIVFYAFDLRGDRFNYIRIDNRQRPLWQRKFRWRCR
jgi:bifunctional non-homologous end joining protein LigD